MTVLAILARGIRDQFIKQMGPALLEHGFVPLGCDGSRLECPRTDELLRHLKPLGNLGFLHDQPNAGSGGAVAVSSSGAGSGFSTPGSGHHCRRTSAPLT